jgi:SAM-dependent methyltransferase
MIDRAIDDLYPDEVAELSARHFTPVAVARRAAELLAPTPHHRVLDLGAGPGKLCIVGAATTGAHFTGIELRRHFVRAAIAASSRLLLRNVHFIHADILDVEWRPYDSYYLFNPFAEHLIGAIDGTVAARPTLFSFYVDAVGRRLRGAPPGTRVVTYHGFGGHMPPGYRLAAREKAGSDELELWIREARAPGATRDMDR